MAITLHIWTPADKKALMALCNAVDRTFLSDRLPNPYTEAVRQICKIAFQELALERITATVFEGNRASERVLEKNGFRLEETKTGAVVKGGKALDVRLYRLDF
jgi:hypothetical protein